MPHGCHIAGVSSPAAITTKNVTEGEDPIYNCPTTGKRSKIKSDPKMQNSFEETNDTLLKRLKENLKTQREDSMFREVKNRHGQEIYSSHVNL